MLRVRMPTALPIPSPRLSWAPRSVVWAGLIGVLFAAQAKAQTPQQVNQGIDRGIAYLRGQQGLNGRWEQMGDYEGGVTALALLALLSCDIPANDERMQAGLKYLETVKSDQTYVVALQTMVFSEADKKRYFTRIRDNARWLMKSRLPGGRWSYGTRNIGDGDNSNTQYALLGLQAAAEAGVEIGDDFWSECRKHWVASQTEVGSWGYRGRGASGSMTVAGIASLVITGRQLRGVQTGNVDGFPVRCNGAKEDVNLRKALDWVGRNFSVERNTGEGSTTWLYYYLYGLERAGRLSGRRFFGDHDWYREGVRFLVARQEFDGSWSVPGHPGVYRLTDTAFALLFLSKGRIPILINKLMYGIRDNWNKAPNDVNNMTVFMSKLWNRKLNWQVVDVRAASVTDLMQAPILHMSGHQAPNLSPGQKKLLRQYIDQGGVLVVDANCSLPGFDRGFRDLCKEIFPEPGAELHPLDPEHGVWTSSFNLKTLAGGWPLEGIEVGCRTGVFYSPEDLSCNWEYQDDNSIPALRLGANIISYVTGAEQLQDKLAERKVFKEGAEDEIKRNYLQVAKLRHGGDWNPAPMAVRNLAASLHDIAKVDVVRQQRDMDLLDPNLPNYPFSYMHGRTKFALNPQERENLAQYLRDGGVLFADACCGSEKFDESFRSLCSAIFPDRKLTPIPPEHELYTRDIGYDLKSVTFTRALDNKQGTPQLEGIEVDGRYVVIYSKYDIGCALERHQSSDCKGYSHDSALKIATNVVLYALKQ